MLHFNGAKKRGGEILGGYIKLDGVDISLRQLFDSQNSTREKPPFAWQSFRVSLDAKAGEG